MSAAVEAVAPTWVTVYHMTINRFEKPAYEAIIASFLNSEGIGPEATLSYDTEEDCFEAGCLSTYASDVLDILSSVVSRYMLENGKHVSVMEEAIVDWDAYMDAREAEEKAKRADFESPLIDFGQVAGAIEWGPHEGLDFAKLVLPHIVKELETLTGCALQINHLSKEIKILPGVTGQPSEAAAKLTVLAQALSRKPVVFHLLKVKPDIDLEYALFKLLDTAEPYNNFDGSLTRILVSPDIQPLASKDEKHLGKAIANFRMIRAFKDPPTSKELFLTVERTEIGSVSLTGVTAPKAAVIQEPLDKASTTIHEWMNKVPSTGPNPDATSLTQNENIKDEPDPGPASSVARSVKSVTAQAPRDWETNISDANPWSAPKFVRDDWGPPVPRMSDFPPAPGLANVVIDPSTRNFPVTIRTSPRHIDTLPPFVPTQPAATRGRGQTMSWSRVAQGHSSTRSAFPGAQQGPQPTRGFPFRRGQPYIGAHQGQPTRGTYQGRGSQVPWGQAGRGSSGAASVSPDSASTYAIVESPQDSELTWEQNQRTKAGARAGEAEYPTDAPTGPRDPLTIQMRPGTYTSQPKKDDPEDDEQPQLIKTMRHKAPAPRSIAGSVAPSESTVVSNSSNSRKPANTKIKAPEVSGNQIKARERMEAGGLEAGAKAIQNALDEARSFQGHLEIRVEIGQIFISTPVPSDSRTQISHNGFVSTMQERAGFDTLYENFTPGVTTRMADLDYILDFAGVQDKRAPYEITSTLQFECQTSSKEKLTMTVDFSNDAATTQVKTAKSLFGAWYSHHPLRIWDHRLVVTGEGSKDLKDVSGMAALRESLYVRFKEDPQVQARDGGGVRVQHTKLIKKLRYRVSPGSEIPERTSMFYLEIAQVTELQMLRPDPTANHDATQRGVFLGALLPDEVAEERQYSWCEVSFGFVNPPKVLLQNEKGELQIGDRANWQAKNDVPEAQLRQLYNLGTALVEHKLMDNIGSQNRGLAANYERSKRARMANTAASRAAMSEWD